nr:MarR family transcriptional regulator [Spelaeicoccus albus]
MATDLASEIEFLTARARSVGTARANAMLAPLDLRVSSYCVLALACSDEGPSQRELAEFLHLDPSQIVSLVDRLEKRDAVRREPDARDRRSKVVAATTSGRELYDHARAAVREAEDQSMAPLTHEERLHLKALLRRVAFVSEE